MTDKEDIDAARFIERVMWRVFLLMLGSAVAGVIAYASVAAMHERCAL